MPAVPLVPMAQLAQRLQRTPKLFSSARSLANGSRRGLNENRPGGTGNTFPMNTNTNTEGAIKRTRA